MESIFKDVDEDRTIANAKRVLGDYYKWKLRARRVNLGLQSPSMDGMPKSPSFGNHVEDKLVNKANAEFMANLVVNVIKAIEIDDQTATYTRLLELKYIHRYTNVKCAQELDNMPERTFDVRLREATLMFAEIYPDTVDNLIVHKYEPLEPTKITIE